MSTARQYTSGTDVSVYLTDDLRLPAGAPPRFDPQDELDVAGVTIVQEGNVLPLYDFANHLVKHFAYATRLVTGSLEFNFNEDFMRRHRSGRRIQNSTLWFVLSRIEWAPETRIVHDYLRADFVWEHPFSHQPAPHAQESVPFSARSLKLVARHIADVDPEQLPILFEEEGGVYTQEGSDFFRRQTRIDRARVINVTDADTIKVKIESTGEQINVRLMSVDAAETTKDAALGFKQNKSNDASWRWPAYAPTHGLGAAFGDGGTSPSKEQLDAWGDYATDVVKAILPEDAIIELITDPGASPTDDPQFDPFSGEPPRYMYRISTDSVGDLGAFLIENGLATPWYASSVEFDPDTGTYTSRMALIEQKYKTARALAGTPEAKGAWYSFDVTDFDIGWSGKGDTPLALP